LQAEALILSSVEPLKSAKLGPQGIPVLMTTKVPEGETVLHEELHPDPEAVDSAISVYVQVGPRSVVQDVTLELLCQILDKVRG
jgi:hypothetical protein